MFSISMFHTVLIVDIVSPQWIPGVEPPESFNVCLKRRLKQMIVKILNLWCPYSQIVDNTTHCFFSSNYYYYHLISLHIDGETTQYFRFFIATLTDTSKPELALHWHTGINYIMTLGKIVAQAATSGECELTYSPLAAYVSWCIQAPWSRTKNFNAQHKLVQIYRHRKDERLSWPE